MAEEQNKQNQNNDATSATGTSGIGGSEFSPSNQDAFSDQDKTENKQSSGAVDKLASTVGNVLRGETGAATGAARGIVSQVKESGGKVASEALGQVKEKAAAKIDEQKTNLAQGLGSVAETIRQVGGNLREATGENEVASTAAKYGDSLANQVEQFSGYLEKHNISDLLREVEGFARRNPAYFIGGAFVLGLLGARFLKSSNPHGEDSNTGEQEVFHHHTPAEGPEEGSGEGIRLE